MSYRGRFLEGGDLGVIFLGSRMHFSMQEKSDRKAGDGSQLLDSRRCRILIIQRMCTSGVLER